MRYGLIGFPLSHSLSPEIHQQFGNHSYKLHPLTPKELPAFLQKRSFLGINVTHPYKTAVIPYLDELDPTAQAIGAVNTIVQKENHLIGYNTDAYGFLHTLQRHGISLNHQTILLLGGSGGAAKAVSFIIKKYFSAQLFSVSRTPKSGELSYEDCLLYHRDATVIINATPVGMEPLSHASPIDLAPFSHCQIVIDLIYRPQKTILLKQADAQSMYSINGLDMLLAQAKKAHELFFGETIIDDVLFSIEQSLRLYLQ